jgi:hypothetical protein
MANNIVRYRPREYPTEAGSKEPITGGLGAILGTVGNLMLGMIDIPIDVAKAVAIKSPDQAGIPEVSRSSTYSGTTNSKAGSVNSSLPSRKESSGSSRNYERPMFTSGTSIATPGTSVATYEESINGGQHDNNQRERQSSDAESSSTRVPPLRTQSLAASSSRSTSEFGLPNSAQDPEDSLSMRTLGSQETANSKRDNSQERARNVNGKGKGKMGKVAGKITAAKVRDFSKTDLQRLNIPGIWLWLLQGTIGERVYGPINVLEGHHWFYQKSSSRFNWVGRCSRCWERPGSHSIDWVENTGRLYYGHHEWVSQCPETIWR